MKPMNKLAVEVAGHDRDEAVQLHGLELHVQRADVEGRFIHDCLRKVHVHVLQAGLLVNMSMNVNHQPGSNMCIHRFVNK